ncbi:YeaH/YhbH family protein [Pokkaliibacter sp. CJK22405]|uniref:YeaH/YhbH family protein n=1 Tax=Pokkaliibacter sp. CJK22405 TaxID=3384615 RepID=UPI003985076B
MTYIIDRRLHGKNKSTVNRQRFLERYRKHIKEAVSDAINSRSITDVSNGSDITIPRRDISEPNFHHGQGGLDTRTLPGNKEFVTGDEIQRPNGGGGGGAGQGKASNSGEGMDEFTFHINRDEFLEFIFEDLELPNLVKKHLKDTQAFERRLAGFTSHGTPEKLHVVRTLRSAYSRRIALTGSDRRQLRELQQAREQILNEPPISDDMRLRLKELDEEIETLKARIKRLPFLDDIDLRYRNMVKTPLPSSKAVMFCIMDVSGSMTRETKDIAKRFFMLLFLFLERNYKSVEVVFIRHHTRAKEVDEEEFFYSRETGGTIVSSALELSRDILKSRYSPSEWNIYMAQASDGDNWDGDSASCRKLITESLLPLVQYYAYVEITTNPHQNLWHEYEQILDEHPDSFAMQRIESPSDIYPVFRELFKRKVT